MMRSEHRILLLIFISYLVLLLGMISFFGYNGLYGQDSHEYLRYCKSLYSFLKEGQNPGSFFWTVGYPFLGAVFSFIMNSQLAMQLIPVLSACWILFIVSSYLMNEFPGREWEVAVFSLLFLGCSPYFLRYSVSVMSDIPATAFLVSAWYFADRFKKLDKTIFFLISVFMVSATLLIRIALFPLTVPLWIFIVLQLISKFDLKKTVGSFILVVLPMVLHFYFKSENPVGFLNNVNLNNWSFLNYLSRNFSTIDGISHYTLPNIIFVFSSFIHPGFVFMGIIFIFLMWYNKRQPSFLFKPLVFAILLYVFFLCGISFQNSRFMVPVVPFFLVMCFPSYLTILSWLHFRWKSFIMFIFSVALIQMMLAYRAFLPFYTANLEEKRIVSMVLKYEPKTIYTFGVDGAMRSYGFTGELINLYNKPLDSLVNNSYLVFNKSENEKQWAGRNPMINFELIMKSGQTKLIEKSTDGWELYEINKKYSHPYSGISGIRK